MKQETFNRIDIVYKRLEASKGKISYAILCREAKTARRSISEYFRVREGRESLSSSTGTGTTGTGTTGTGTIETVSLLNLSFSNLPEDLEALRRLKELKEEELFIITELYNKKLKEHSSDLGDYEEELQFRNKEEENASIDAIEGMLNKEDLTVQNIQDSISYLFQEFRGLEALKSGYLLIFERISKYSSIFIHQEVESLKTRFIETLITLNNKGIITPSEIEQTLKEVNLVTEYQEYLAA